MRLKYLIAEFKKNWLIASIGIVLYFFGFAILNVNEGRSFRHNRALVEALAEAISFKDSVFQPDGKTEDFEGKLLHIAGLLAVQEPIADATYNILVQAVKLRKFVQMYQWHEGYTETRYEESDATHRSYYYFKDWSDEVIDSRSFQHSFSHQNPRQLPMQTKIMIADRAFIGNFEIGDAAKEMFEGWTDVTSDTRPEDPYIKMHLGWYFHVDDLFDPLIGDTRVKFQFTGLQGAYYTVVGKLINGRIQPYESKVRKRILLLAKGELTIDEIFKEEHHTARKRTWFIRFFGFALLFFGVLSTESLLRVFSRTKLSFLCPHPMGHVKTNVKIAAILAITVCVLRQSLHYAGIMS